MSAIAKFENLKDLIVELRGQSVLLDSDVAELYRVETKRINEAVKNNPDKFPHDYMFEISEGEFADLRSKFSTTKFAKTRALPKAFTEKGLEMWDSSRLFSSLLTPDSSALAKKGGTAPDYFHSTAFLTACASSYLFFLLFLWAPV